MRAIATMERGIDGLERLIAAQRETIGLLVIQLAARTREVRELHELLRTAQEQALTPQMHDVVPLPGVSAGGAPVPQRPVWRRWLDRVVRGARRGSQSSR